MDILKEICLEGDAYSIGYKHGLSQRHTIQDFLADDFARINLIRYKKLEKQEIFNFIEEYKIIIKEDVPLIAQELQGLADGAGISYEKAILLQIRREIIGQPSLSRGECSLVAKFENNEAIIAQTIDLNGNMTDLGKIFRISPLDQNIPEILMFSFSGLLGFTGMNSSGLGIGINFVSSEGWKPGVSPYLLVRHLLQLNTLDECLDELQRIRRSSSRSLTICDRSGLAIVEMTVDDLRVIKGSKLTRTNHFLHSDFIKLDKLNIFSRNASKLRLKRLNDLIDSKSWKSCPDILFEIFSDHSLFPVGLCVHSGGNVRKEDTVASVALDLQNSKLFVRKGHPCSNETQSFHLVPETDILKSKSP